MPPLLPAWHPDDAPDLQPAEHARRRLRRDGERGLSDFGRAAIAEMNRVGVLVDVAHSGWRTSLEAAKASRHPVVASHSGCDAVHHHIRCKPDDVIRAIVDPAGSSASAASPVFWAAAITAMLDHIDYMVRTFGVDHVAIGTDVAYTLAQRPRREQTKLPEPPPETPGSAALWPKDSLASLPGSGAGQPRLDELAAVHGGSGPARLPGRGHREDPRRWPMCCMERGVGVTTACNRKVVMNCLMLRAVRLGLIAALCCHSLARAADPPKVEPALEPDPKVLRILQELGDNSSALLTGLKTVGDWNAVTKEYGLGRTGRPAATTPTKPSGCPTANGPSSVAPTTVRRTGSTMPGSSTCPRIPGSCSSLLIQATPRASWRSRSSTLQARSSSTFRRSGAAQRITAIHGGPSPTTPA